MGYWRCPRCATENHLDARSCAGCGYQYFAGAEEGASTSGAPGRLADFVRKQRQEISEEIKKGLDAAAERTKPSLERLSGEPAAPAGGKDTKARPR